MRGSGWIGLAGSAVIALAGCTASVAGQGEPAPPPSGSSGPSTTSAPPPPPPIGPGTVVEAHRVAGATLLVGRVLPELTDNCGPSGPYVDPAETEAENGLFVPGTAAAVLRQYGFVAAWTYCRTDGADRATTMMVAELADAASASAAAEALMGTLAVARFTETELTDLPEARALIREEDGAVDLHVVLPVNRMLGYAYHSEVDPALARTNAATVMSAQGELLAGFQPTPQDRVPGLDSDPFDLERRVLDPPALLTNISGSFGLTSYLRVAISPETEEQLLLDNNFIGAYAKVSEVQDGLSYQTVVYEFASLPDTNIAYDGFVRIEEEEFDNRTPFTVPLLPTAPCYYFPVADGSDQLYQRCYVRVRGYLASVDIVGITDPADTALMNTLLREQKTQLND